MSLGHVILVCGVSGVGKTWVCQQVADKFHYIPHDEHYHNFFQVLLKAAKSENRPFITEVPFGERIQRDKLRHIHFDVTPVFVIEKAPLVAARYLAREGKPISKAAFTRASTIIERAREWGAFYGTSPEVLEHLKHKEL